MTSFCFAAGHNGVRCGNFLFALIHGTSRSVGVPGFRIGGKRNQPSSSLYTSDDMCATQNRGHMEQKRQKIFIKVASWWLQVFQSHLCSLRSSSYRNPVAAENSAASI
jgi:hypothetical protein